VKMVQQQLQIIVMVKRKWSKYDSPYFLA